MKFLTNLGLSQNEIQNNAYNGNNGLRPASMDRSTY